MIKLTNRKGIKMSTYSTRLRVRVSDINYGGHLGNDKMLTFFHEARVRYLGSLGLSELDIGAGVSLTQTEAHVYYKAEAFLGDELEVFVLFDQFTRTRFSAQYRVVRISDQRLMATGDVTLAGFNYQTHKPERIPESFKETIYRFQNA